MHEQQTWTLRMCLRGKKKMPIKTTERAEQRKPAISHRLILIYCFHLFPFFFQFQTREKNKKEKRFSCLPVLLIALKLSYIFYMMMMMMKWGQICNLIHGLKPALTMVVVQVAFAVVNVGKFSYTATFKNSISKLAIE